MDPKEVLKKIVTQERNFRKREFLAPYTEGMRTAIVKMSGMNYRFRIVGFTGSGIGMFEPIDHSCARFKGDADFATTRKYLDILPQLHVILVYESDQGWIAYPMNMESTCKKFALDGEIIVKNVSDAERFDVITARFDGMHFWYDDVFHSADLMKSSFMRDAFDPASLLPSKMREKIDEIKGLTPEDKESFELAIRSWNYFKRVTAQEELEQILAVGGGRLLSYVVRGANLEVRWKSKQGNPYTSSVEKGSYDVVCAGICVDGEDKKFHFKDLPGIADMGEQEDAIYRTMGRDIDYDGIEDFPNAE